MEDAYNEGYFYFDTEHDAVFTPYPPEINMISEDDYREFHEGYNDAKLEYIFDQNNIVDFLVEYEDLLKSCDIEDIRCNFKAKINDKYFYFTLADFQQYMEKHNADLDD